MTGSDDAYLTQGVSDSEDDSADGDESYAQRLTRNYNELLQELRVVQTGVQILTGFLLTLPFTSRFPDLDSVQRTSYLVVLVGSVCATAFIVAPVAFHRMLFRKGQRPWLVQAANQSARVGLGLLGLTTAGMMWLVFDVVTTRWAGMVAGVVALVFFATLWLAFPVLTRRVSGASEQDDDRDARGSALAARPGGPTPTASPTQRGDRCEGGMGGDSGREPGL